MMESLRRSNVATYAIDPRGLVRSADLLHECFPPPAIPDPCSGGLTDWESVVRQAQHGLEIMSEASGGFAVTNTDDFTGGLDRIVTDLDHYYLLGFYPEDPKGKGYRPIDVRVAGHPDWRLHFRRGYMPGGPPPPPKNTDPLVALSAGILPKTDLPLRLTAVALPPLRSTGVTKSARVALALEVSARVRDLQETDARLRYRLKYEVLVVDEAKKKVTSVSGLEGRITLSPGTTEGPPPETVAYQVAGAIELPPGRYQLRVSATSVKLAKGGSVYLNVDVPDFSAAPLAMSGIVLGYADGPHVPVAPSSMSGAAPSAALLPFPPSLNREFTTSDELRLYFEFSSRTPAVSPKATIEVRSATGHVHTSIASDVGPGDTSVDVQVPLQELAPGAYILRATVTDQGRSATRDVGFVIK